MAKSKSSSSRIIRFIAFLILLGLAYVFGSLAIDTGRWLFYLTTAVLILLGLSTVVGLIRNEQE